MVHLSAATSQAGVACAPRAVEEVGVGMVVGMVGQAGKRA